MGQPKKLEHTALFGLVMQVVFLFTCLLIAAKTGSVSVRAEAWHVAAGLLVWFLVLVHGRQRRLAREEQEELERLRAGRLSEELFEETELDTMRAKGGLLVFEKYLVPLFTVVLAGLLVFFAYRIGTGLWHDATSKIELPSAVAVGMIFVAFAGFLIGKYAAGLAQYPEYRLLRAAAGYVLGNAIAAVLIAVSMALYHFHIEWAERVVAYLIPVIMALVALEVLLNLLLDIYRPRVPGQERRPPYDSRLLGLFAEPEGVVKTVAATLDYQFGFKVSETWFYRFMERAILPLFLVDVFALWMLSCIVVVKPHEVGFLEVLGRPYVTAQDAAKGLPASVLEPGFHLKWPWPIALATHVPAYETLSVELGKVYQNRSDVVPMGKVMRDPNIILWTERHIDPRLGWEVNFLVPSMEEVRARAHSEAPGSAGAAPQGESAATPAVATGAVEQTEMVSRVPQVNLARLLANVYYRVKRLPDGRVDPVAAFTFRYRQHDLKRHIQQLAYRALCRIAASQDFLKWVAQERGKTVAQFRRLLDEAVEQENLGVEIVYAGIPAVHPPVETAGAFEGVITAMETKEGDVFKGQRTAARLVKDALAIQAETINRAVGYKAQLVENAKAERDKFLVQLSVYRKAPQIFLSRVYLDTIEDVLKDQKVMIVPVAQEDVEVIDMQERLRPQLLELDVNKNQEGR